ncbi:MAG: VacJ family lipoprotein [Syntrophaceae bacterium]|nr:VacJ family lipoprotein [Syntrophaceae bacterium]
MKPYIVFVLSFIFIMAGSSDYSFAVLQSSSSSPSPVLLASASERVEVKSADEVNQMEEEYREDEFDNYVNDEFKEEKVEIADPLEPFNRGMHEFNDKMYFWAIKPIAEAYNKVVPEPVRISVKNFFSNLGFPARFLSCLLQADFSGATTETGRFTINTIWGIGGFLDPSSGKELNLQKQDTDLGQTLGVWGVGQGFYIVWPVFGPSSPRDTVSIAGDYFLYPVSYLTPWYARLGLNVYDKINSASLRIGDYEALKDAAIDPYIAFRDAYVQYRFKKIKARKAKLSSSTTIEEESPTSDKKFTEKEM